MDIALTHSLSMLPFFTHTIFYFTKVIYRCRQVDGDTMQQQKIFIKIYKPIAKIKKTQEKKEKNQ